MLKPSKTSLAQAQFWPEGLTPFDFQLRAVHFALQRENTYLALDPGLGKTIIAALILNKLQETKPAKAYFICPPFLTTNVDAEFSRWCLNKNLFLIPDSMLAKKEVIAKIKDDFSKFKGQKILFVDEAHRFKNEKALRSKALFMVARHFSRVVFLSGTPLPNSRPVEIWPIVSRFAPDVFGGNFFAYAKRYCGAFKDTFGWKFDGFTNKSEFKTRLTKSFMLRLRKDVLTLPDKIEGILTVGENLPPIVSGLERKILAHYTKEDLTESKIAETLGKGALHISEYLKHLGEYKLKYVFPYIEHLLYNTHENILIFAHHKQVIEQLSLWLKNFQPCIITGATPVKERDAIIKDYQNNRNRRVFIGNIQACGVGFTLTKATRVLFVEFSWRDGDNIQASDRAHRIGQNASVLVQYVVLKDSFDAKRMQILLTKRQNAV